MKKSIFILIITSIFLGFNAYSQSNPRMENPDYAVTVFYDDFETGSNWRDKWIPVNNEALISPNFGNILIWKDSTATINQSLGKLSLIARGYEGYTTTDGNGNPITADYISGSVKSKDRFLYGVFECNATFGYKHGSFPAFWLYFDSICGYDYGSEIDIVELKYEDPNPGLDTHAFYYPCATGGYQPVYGSWSDNPFNWSVLNPHTFKCIWTPTKTEWYVDSTLLNTIDETEVDYYPNKTMVMILSQQLWPYDDELDNIEVPVASTFNWVRAKKFFLAPEITVPNLICTQENAILDVASEAYDFSWVLSPSNLFSGSKTGTGKTATITPASNVGSLGTITYTFKMPSGESYETFTAEKTFWVGKPVINNISGPQNLPYGGNQVYTADVSGAESATYQWSVSPSLPLTSYGDNVQISFPSTNGDYVITLVVTDCGTSDPYYYYVATGEYEINIIYPNPATDETTLSLASALPVNDLDDLQEWEYEIYTQNQSLKEKKTKLKGYTTKINTSGWKEGVYIVRVKYGKLVFQEKLIIER